MRSVVPVLNFSPLTEIKHRTERLEYHLKELGHEVIWLDDVSALNLLQSSPLKIRVAFIVRIIDHRLRDRSLKLTVLIRSRFLSAQLIEESASQISERIIALSEGYSLVGKKISSDVVNSALRFIYRSLDSPDLSVQRIASAVNLSKDKLEKEFLKELGGGVWHTVIAMRVREAKRILIETDSRINEIGMALGIVDPSIFTRTFTKIVGVSPKAFRSKSQTKLQKVNFLHQKV